MSEPRVYLAGGVRTPIGNFGGALAASSAAELGGFAARAARERAGVPAEAIDEVIVGHARQAGNGPNLARQIVRRSGLADTVPAFTIHKACASGLQAVVSVAQSVRLGETATQAVAPENVLNGNVFDAAWLKARGESVANLRKMILSAPPWHNVFNAITTTRPTWNGHNSSTWHEEVLAVNGFDERLGYGGLDREFGERLERCGMKGIQARYTLICLHLDHPRPYREREIMEANLKIRRENARNRVRRTAYGLVSREPAVQRW